MRGGAGWDVGEEEEDAEGEMDGDGDVDAEGEWVEDERVGGGSGRRGLADLDSAEGRYVFFVLGVFLSAARILPSFVC